MLLPCLSWMILMTFPRLHLRRVLEAQTPSFWCTLSDWSRRYPSSFHPSLSFPCSVHKSEISVRKKQGNCVYLLHTWQEILHIFQGKKLSSGGQREELHPWQRSWGRRLGIRKGVIKPQETPCSRASTHQTRVCFMLSNTPLTLRGALPHNRFSWRKSKRAAPRQ